MKPIYAEAFHACNACESGPVVVHESESQT
jgi:hypothetical protein